MRKIAEITGNFPSLGNGGTVPRLNVLLDSNGDDYYVQGNNTGEIGPFFPENEVWEFVRERIERLPEQYVVDGRSGLPEDIISWIDES